MLQYRLPDGRSLKRLWEGWVGFLHDTIGFIGDTILNCNNISQYYCKHLGEHNKLISKYR